MSKEPFEWQNIPQEIDPSKPFICHTHLGALCIWILRVYQSPPRFRRISSLSTDSRLAICMFHSSWTLLAEHETVFLLA
jgi:hypothetical protein